MFQKHHRSGILCASSRRCGSSKGGPSSPSSLAAMVCAFERYHVFKGYSTRLGLRLKEDSSFAISHIQRILARPTVKTHKQTAPLRLPHPRIPQDTYSNMLLRIYDILCSSLLYDCWSPSSRPTMAICWTSTVAVRAQMKQARRTCSCLQPTAWCALLSHAIFQSTSIDLVPMFVFSAVTLFTKLHTRNWTCC